MSGNIIEMFGSGALAFSSDASEAPSEIQVIPSGYHETPKGAFLLSEKAAGKVIADFKGRGSDMVIDYEHQSLTGEEAPAAGWIKELVYHPPSSPLAKGGKEGGGIWARVEWTKRAGEYLRNREYRYLSPVFLVNRQDCSVERLVNAALTNTPAIGGMAALVMKDAGTHAQDEGGKEDGANPLKDIASALGLKPESGVSEILGAIEAFRQGFDAYGAIKSELDAIKDDMKRREAREMVAIAMKEGKVTPAQKDWAMKYAEDDPAGFGVFVMKAARVAPVVSGRFAGRAPRIGLDAMQEAVNAQLGMDDETFGKYCF